MRSTYYRPTQSERKASTTISQNIVVYCSSAWFWNGQYWYIDLYINSFKLLRTKNCKTLWVHGVFLGICGEWVWTRQNIGDNQMNIYQQFYETNNVFYFSQYHCIFIIVFDNLTNIPLFALLYYCEPNILGYRG